MRAGVSAEAPEKKCVEEWVRIRRIEMLGWWRRARIRRGSLMLATEPVAARRMWVLRSEAKSEARKGGGWSDGVLFGGFVDAIDGF